MADLEITLEPNDILILRQFVRHIDTCKPCGQITKATGAFRLCSGGSWAAGKVFRILDHIPGIGTVQHTQEDLTW